jgi:hypothetical protein
MVSLNIFLNHDKTQNIVFTLKNKSCFSSKLETKEVKYLGMVLDSQLNWAPHVDLVTRRASRVLFLLKKLHNVVPLQYVITSYFAFFQSIIRYGLIFYGNSATVKNILLIQKKVVRHLTRSAWDAHCRPLFIKLRILTVFNLYIFDLVLYTFNNINNLSLRGEFHTYSTRNRAKFDVQFCRLTKTQSSHFILGVKLINKLPFSIFTLSLKLFKKRFYDWLIDNPFYSVKEFLEFPSDKIVL